MSATMLLQLSVKSIFFFLLFWVSAQNKSPSHSFYPASYILMGRDAVKKIRNKQPHSKKGSRDNITVKTKSQLSSARRN